MPNFPEPVDAADLICGFVMWDYVGYSYNNDSRTPKTDMVRIPYSAM